MILSEGAGAILLGRRGALAVERSHPGGFFARRAEAEEILEKILSDLSETEIDLVISSADGTFVDQAESRALSKIIPNALVYTGKPALGERVDSQNPKPFLRASTPSTQRFSSVEAG